MIYGRRCLDYLNLHQNTIDEDKNAISLGRDSKRRRAGISSVLSDIYLKFGAFKRAFEHTNRAIDYALKYIEVFKKIIYLFFRHTETNEPLFLYQCYFGKSELLRGKSFLELLETMRTYASKHKIKENRDILDRKYYMVR